MKTKEDSMVCQAMNKLKALKTIGFQIPWELMRIGLYGFCEIPVILSRPEIIAYLYDSINEDDHQTDCMIRLICEEDPGRFDELLKSYAENDPCDVLIQKRKWRVYLLKTLLENLSQDYFQGILEFMEFWVAMGDPEDGPHILPPETGDPAKSDYFTETNYGILVSKCKKWLYREISEIINAENF